MADSNQQMELSQPRAIDAHRTLLAKAEPSFAAAIPEAARSVLTPQRVTKIMLAALSRNQTLLSCTPQSILQVCLDASSLGLEAAGPLGHLYAVPYRNKHSGQYEAQTIVGYRGLIELARRSGAITSIEARCVYANDTFELEFGFEPVLRHKPCWTGDRGEIVAAYCVSEFVTGQRQIEFMTRSEIDAIRRRSRAADSGPWVSDYAEMARKTVTRRACKYLPMIDHGLATALELEANAESGDVPFTVAVEAAAEQAQTRAQKITAKLKQKDQEKQQAQEQEQATNE